MQISSTAQQLIDIHRQSATTDLAIATAVAGKQIEASKQIGEAAVALVQSAAQSSLPARGLDVKA